MAAEVVIHKDPFASQNCINNFTDIQNTFATPPIPDYLKLVVHYYHRHQ